MLDRVSRVNRIISIGKRFRLIVVKVASNRGSSLK
jgi:hypothetical protein